MSAPDLPEIFGNYALRDFIELIAPTGVSWLPQTLGWRWLAVGLALITLRALYNWLRQWVRDRYRREADKRLQQIIESSEPENFLHDVNRLLKLTAMVAFGRQDVARLSGSEWVTFLNAQCTEPSFTSEEEVLLEQGAYCSKPPSEATRNELIQACRQWVSAHGTQPHV